MTVGDRLVRAERLLMLLRAGCTEEGLDTYGSIEQMANTLHRFLDEVEYEVLVAKDHLDASSCRGRLAGILSCQKLRMRSF
jgi:hypothetical protein